MKALAVFGFMLGVLAMLSQAYPLKKEPSFDSVAINYATYRNAAFNYVLKNKAIVGSVADGVLPLPHGWTRIRQWQTRVEASRCYVYGPASGTEISSVRELFLGSAAVGTASGGYLLPQIKSPIPIPNFVPDGFLVSVIEVK